MQILNNRLGWSRVGCTSDVAGLKNPSLEERPFRRSRWSGCCAEAVVSSGAGLVEHRADSGISQGCWADGRLFQSNQISFNHSLLHIHSPWFFVFQRTNPRPVEPTKCRQSRTIPSYAEVGTSDGHWELNCSPKV